MLVTVPILFGPVEHRGEILGRVRLIVESQGGNLPAVVRDVPAAAFVLLGTVHTPNRGYCQVLVDASAEVNGGSTLPSARSCERVARSLSSNFRRRAKV